MNYPLPVPEAFPARPGYHGNFQKDPAPPRRLVPRRDITTWPIGSFRLSRTAASDWSATPVGRANETPWGERRAGAAGGRRRHKRERDAAEGRRRGTRQKRDVTPGAGQSGPASWVRGGQSQGSSEGERANGRAPREAAGGYIKAEGRPGPALD